MVNVAYNKASYPFIVRVDLDILYFSYVLPLIRIHVEVHDLCQLDSHFNLPFEFRAQTPPYTID